MEATAQAQPNIALVKYWGKQAAALNLPSVPSLSITLESLWTRTYVSFRKDIESDQFILNGVSIHDPRVSQCLDRLRQLADVSVFAKIDSTNNFPTGAGLASSASGFAALVTAADHALGLNLSDTQRSQLARRSSGSAARSIFGGFVEMPTQEGEDAFARPLLDYDRWPLKVLVAITSISQKSVSSTFGMQQTAETSDFYAAWVENSQRDFSHTRSAVRNHDFESLAELSELSCLKMHGLMLSTRPGLVYWNGATVELIHKIRRLRGSGLPVFFTIDAGPQVKAVCLPGYENQITRSLETVPGVIDILPSDLGPGARLLES